MATVLPPIVPSPFGKYFHQQQDILTTLDKVRLDTVSTSKTSLASDCSSRGRQATPSSVTSAVPATLACQNDENQGSPQSHHSGFSSPSRRTISLREPRRDLGCTSLTLTTPPRPTNNKRYGKALWSAERGGMAPERPLPASLSRLNSQDDSTALSPSSNLTSVPQKSKPTLQQQWKPPITEQPMFGSPIQEIANEDDVGATGRNNFKDWASTFRRKKKDHGLEDISPLLQDLISAVIEPSSSLHPGLTAAQYSGHHQRLSNASSGFIGTVKTASLSNASFNVIPGAHHKMRSSGTQGHQNSDARFSLDSDRPVTRPSLDERALGRGLRRRMILQEIIASEENYVGDLGALCGLFSTLLASSHSLSPRARMSIQRNLSEILHFHGQLVREFQLVAATMNSRPYYHATPTRRLGIYGRRFRARTEGSISSGQLPRMHSPRTSVDSGDQQNHTRAAEPVEAAAIARILKTSSAGFLVYEEYCSNHDAIAFELAAVQKSNPWWPFYESGLEALARSLQAINRRHQGSQRALTVRDLLMSPIQRLTKYPLLLAELHKCTPVIDCPVSHAQIDVALRSMQEIAVKVNRATNNMAVRDRTRRCCLLHDLLMFNDEILQPAQFRKLGHPTLCGVLHLAYQTVTQVTGCYGLSVLCGSHLLLAIPANSPEKFRLLAVIDLADLKLVSTTDGRGLQCFTALFSWKLLFEANHQLYEVILSACSAIEEEQWRTHLEQQKNRRADEIAAPDKALCSPMTTVAPELRSAGVVFGQAPTLARRLSIQRAATVGNRINICQVIIRNTHSPLDNQDSRLSRGGSVNRSQSLMNTIRTVVLSPKRSERVRLENSLRDVWTRETLPFPGMVMSRGGHIIRASAGSLVRKLSQVSMHGPFRGRSTSLTITTKRPSTEMFPDLEIESAAIANAVDGKSGSEIGPGFAEHCAFQQETPLPNKTAGKNSRRLSVTGMDRLHRRGTKKSRRESFTARRIAEGATAKDSGIDMVEGRLGGRKRWSNPLGLLKNISSEGIRNILYSSK